MSIKIISQIKLPYIIWLEKNHDYDYNFNFEEYEKFKITFLHNNRAYINIYDEKFPNNISENIYVEAVYKNFNYLKYFDPIKDSKKGCKIYKGEVEIPAEEQCILLKKLLDKINLIIEYLSIKTGEFWIHNLSINPLSESIENGTKFNFYIPNRDISVDGFITHAYNDNYMLDILRNSTKRINENTFLKFSITKKDLTPYITYVNKAETNLYSGNYYDFIIYLSISCESFIKQYINGIKPENDIIFNKLISINYEYIDLYYNVILKYLKNKSLKEIDESAYMKMNQIYKLRNSIMHTGKIDEKALEKSKLCKLDYSECNEMLNKIKYAFKKIREL